MNIDEKLGITSNTNINHRETYKNIEKYWKIVKLFVLDNFKELMPEEPDVLAEKLEQDSALNNIKLSRWNAIAGTYAYIDKSGKQLYMQTDSKLKRLLYRQGITCYSPAELVSILKEAAAEIVEEYNQEKSNIDIER